MKTKNRIVAKAVNAVARNAVKVGDYCTIKSGLRCKESGKTGQIVDLGEFKGRQTFVMKMEDGHTISGFVDSFIDDSSARARNAAGYVDASSVILYPGDAVVFKAQYSSHKDDDEWLERNGDTVREVRGNEVKLGPSANDWAKKSDLMVWHNAARNASVNDPWWVGDAETAVSGLMHGGFPRKSIEELYGKIGRYALGGGIPSLHRLAERLNDLKYEVEKEGKEGFDARQKAIGIIHEIMRVKTTGHNAVRACNSTNAIVRKAMNAAEARNAKVGDSVWWYDEEDRRVYKGFKIDKILSSGLVEISKKGEGSFTVKRSELALPGGMAITWTNSTARNAKDSRKKAANSALPIGDIGVSDSTILWRMIDGGRDEPYHDEYQKRLDKMNQRDIPEDTISILKKYGYKFKNSSAKASRGTSQNAEDDFLQYYADSYSYIPKVGEIYKYDGKRVKCTSVQKLQRGNDDRDRFLVEGRVVG